MKSASALSRRQFFATLVPAKSVAPSLDAPPPAMNTVPASPPSASPTVDPLRLPPLQQAVLDDATINALFRDLACCAQVHAVLPKHHPRQHANAGSISLDSARTRLAAGLLLGVQIRYRFEGASWCDTLLRRPNGTTLVRIREDDVAASVDGN